MLLLAILADHEGDQPRAIDLLLHAGGRRSGAIKILARSLARRLGVAEELAERERQWFDPQHPGEHGEAAAATGMAALNNEMARRGWL